ncbi:MAG: P1 family peptidase [Candidatus Hydrogenedentota bacterium]
MADERPRIRDLGVSPGVLSPGLFNAITDVDGVRVGHCTVIEGDSVRTGVTAILPHGGNLFQEKAPAAVFVGNGFGKAAGFLQIEELGSLESPIVLTNTLSVGTAIQGVVDWILRQPGSEDVRSVNAVVGETNDGYLNDIRAGHINGGHVAAALQAAHSGAVEEGSVGAGTGTLCFGWKGGIGTSSRVLPESMGGYTIGVLVQTNFDGILTIDGRRVGEALGRYAYGDALEEVRSASPQRAAHASDAPGEGSVMIVIATDAPVSARNLKRLAGRAPLGLARTGSFMANGSGDFVIAFSTRNHEVHSPSERTRQVEDIYNDFMGPLFLGVVEAVEEAVYNSLTTATAVTGYKGRHAEAIPIGPLRKILKPKSR